MDMGDSSHKIDALDGLGSVSFPISLQLWRSAFVAQVAATLGHQPSVSNPDGVTHRLPDCLHDLRAFFKRVLNLPSGERPRAAAFLGFTQIPGAVR